MWVTPIVVPGLMNLAAKPVTRRTNQTINLKNQANCTRIAMGTWVCIVQHVMVVHMRLLQLSRLLTMHKPFCNRDMPAQSTHARFVIVKYLMNDSHIVAMIN